MKKIALKIWTKKRTKTFFFNSVFFRIFFYTCIRLIFPLRKRKEKRVKTERELNFFSAFPNFKQSKIKSQILFLSNGEGLFGRKINKIMLHFWINFFLTSWWSEIIKNNFGNFGIFESSKIEQQTSQKPKISKFWFWILRREISSIGTATFCLLYQWLRFHKFLS